MQEKKPKNSEVAKRRCLYFLLISVFFIISLNLGITALLLYYVNISQHSVGEIQLESGKTVINGHLWTDQSLATAKIQSTSNGSLAFVSEGPIQLMAENSALTLDSDLMGVQSGKFIIQDQEGREILHVSPELVFTNFRAVKLGGKAQALTSLQAKQIFSMPSTDMRIASLTQNLKILAAEQLNLATSIGALKLEALKEIELESEKIHLVSKNVFLPSLNGLADSSQNEDIFEVCLCSDGSLFAAKVAEGCFDAARANSLICPSLS